MDKNNPTEFEKNNYLLNNGNGLDILTNEINIDKVNEIRKDLKCDLNDKFYDATKNKSTRINVKEMKRDSYDSYVLKFLSNNKDLVLLYAQDVGVPPIALAMCILDEYQTRKEDFKKLHGYVDSNQDGFVYNNKGVIPYGKDIGPGNINYNTAMKLLVSKGISMTQEELNKYILSDEGTIHLAALALKDVVVKLHKHYKVYYDLNQSQLDEYDYYQHLVEGYRQDPDNREIAILKNYKSKDIFFRTEKIS